MNFVISPSVRLACRTCARSISRHSLWSGVWLAVIVAAPAFAQWGSPESVLPEGHWTYAALKRLRGQRDVDPTLDRRLVRAPILTRSDFADILYDRLQSFKHPVRHPRVPVGPPGPAGGPGEFDKYRRESRRQVLKGEMTSVSRIPELQTLIAEFRNELWLRGEKAEFWILELEERRARIKAIPHSPARARMRDLSPPVPQ